MSGGIETTCSSTLAAPGRAALRTGFDVSSPAGGPAGKGPPDAEMTIAIVCPNLVGDTKGDGHPRLPRPSAQGFARADRRRGASEGVAPVPWTAGPWFDFDRILCDHQVDESPQHRPRAAIRRLRMASESRRRSSCRTPSARPVRLAWRASARRRGRATCAGRSVASCSPTASPRPATIETVGSGRRRSSTCVSCPRPGAWAAPIDSIRTELLRPVARRGRSAPPIRGTRRSGDLAGRAVRPAPE